MSYGNWKYILAVFSFHNYVFNGISVNNTTWRDPLPYLAATFDHLFFFFFLSSLGLMRAFLHPLFFLFPFTLGGFFFFLHCMRFLGFFFLFFFLLLLSLSSVLPFFFSFFFHWVWSSVLASSSFFPSSFTGFKFLGFWFFFFFFFFTGLVSLGIGKKKKNCTEWQVWDLQTVWKILSDDKWVMVPNV